MKKRDKGVHVVKIAPRKFHVTGYLNEGEEVREQVAPAEYAVFKGDERLAGMQANGNQ